MFIGHFGVALAAKKIEPRGNLGAYFLAAQFVDLLWPFMLIAGLESVRIEPGITVATPLDFVSYPITHSLLMALVWSAAAGCLYFAKSKNARAALVMGALVASHWILDFISHRPDLPLWPGGVKVGLGLWNSLPATLVVELAIFAGGVWLYAQSTTAASKKGKIAFWSLIAFLFVVHLANMFGPPPPSVSAIQYSALAMWLIVLWGWWADRNRSPVIK